MRHHAMSKGNMLFMKIGRFDKKIPESLAGGSGIFVWYSVYQHTPRPIMALATFMKPAMLAPFM